MAPPAELDTMMKEMTPEKSKKFDEEWNGWMATLGGALVERGGMLGKNKRVTASGIEDTRNDLTGYSIVEAESHEAAAKLFEKNPMFSMPGAYVEVVALTKV